MAADGLGDRDPRAGRSGTLPSQSADSFTAPNSAAQMDGTSKRLDMTSRSQADSMKLAEKREQNARDSPGLAFCLEDSSAAPWTLETSSS